MNMKRQLYFLTTAFLFLGTYLRKKASAIMKKVSAMMKKASTIMKKVLAIMKKSLAMVKKPLAMMKKCLAIMKKLTATLKKSLAIMKKPLAMMKKVLAIIKLPPAKIKTTRRFPVHALAQVQAHLQTAEKPSLLLCLQKSLSFFLRTVYRIALCTKVLSPLSPIFSGRLALVSIQTAQLPTPAMYYCRIFFIFVKHFSHVTFLPYDTTRTTISATNT